MGFVTASDVCGGRAEVTLYVPASGLSEAKWWMGSSGAVIVSAGEGRGWPLTPWGYWLLPGAGFGMRAVGGFGLWLVPEY